MDHNIDIINKKYMVFDVIENYRIWAEETVIKIFAGREAEVRMSEWTDTKIDGDNLRRAFKKALQKAGIEDFHFHDLRHTFATRLAQNGVDIYTISKLLGHKDIRMTERYSHRSPESLRDGIQVLEVSHNLVTVEYG